MTPGSGMLFGMGGGIIAEKKAIESYQLRRRLNSEIKVETFFDIDRGCYDCVTFRK